MGKNSFLAFMLFHFYTTQDVSEKSTGHSLASQISSSQNASMLPSTIALLSSQCAPVTSPPPRFPVAREGRGERRHTDPEAVEVGVGGIVGLVVSFHQGGNNFGLLLVQTWPHGLAGRLLLLPLHYHVLLPLDLLICQNDCRKKAEGKII